MGTDRGGGSGAGPHCHLLHHCPVSLGRSQCILVTCPHYHLIAVALSSCGSFIFWWLVVGISGAWSWTCLCGCPFMLTVGVCCHLGICQHLWAVIFIVWVVMGCHSHCASHCWPLWCFSVLLFIGGLGWKAHQSTMNDQSAVRHLVAMLLTAMWQLEWALARGTDRDDLLCRVTMLCVVTVR